MKLFWSSSVTERRQNSFWRRVIMTWTWLGEIHGFLLLSCIYTVVKISLVLEGFFHLFTVFFEVFVFLLLFWIWVFLVHFVVDHAWILGHVVLVLHRFFLFVFLLKSWIWPQLILLKVQAFIRRIKYLNCISDAKVNFPSSVSTLLPNQTLWLFTYHLDILFFISFPYLAFKRFICLVSLAVPSC
jgi:hypothetical protein